MPNPLKKAKITALTLKGPDAALDAAVGMADSFADPVEQLDRMCRRSELKGHPDSYSELAKGPIADLTEARREALSLIEAGQLSRSDAAGEALSREQLEEQATALREKIRSARAAVEERSIEEMEADLAALEAKLGDEADEDEDEDDKADGKKDGAKLDAILAKVDHIVRKDAENSESLKAQLKTLKREARFAEGSEVEGYAEEIATIERKLAALEKKGKK